MPKAKRQPVYRKIADDIRRGIHSGKYQPGSPVPSERALEVLWNVSRPTATSALALLRLEGLVESRHGSGTYVVERRSDAHVTESPDVGTIDITRIGNNNVEILLAGQTAGPEAVLDAFGKDRKKHLKVLRRQELFRDKEDDPATLMTSWFLVELADRAPHLTRAQPLSGGIDAYLASAVGSPITHQRDEMKARLATEAECEQLHITEWPSAVLERRLLLIDNKGDVLSFIQALHPPGRWV